MTISELAKLAEATDQLCSYAYHVLHESREWETVEHYGERELARRMRAVDAAMPAGWRQER